MMRSISDLQTRKLGGEGCHGELGLEALDLELGIIETRYAKETAILSRHVSIAKVLQSVTELNGGAYKAAAIGLGYYGRNIKCKYDAYKSSALRRTLLRLKIKEEESLYKYARKHLQGRIRAFYPETSMAASTPAKEDDELIPQVVRDACFLLEFLRSECPDAGTKKATLDWDVVFDGGKDNIVRLEIMKDILKLENQIPLFVLQWILQLEVLTNTREKTIDLLAELLYKFPEFCGFPLEGCKIAFMDFRNFVEKATHLLDLSRLILESLLKLGRPTTNTSVGEIKSDIYHHKPRSVPSAMKLQAAGVILKRSNSESVDRVVCFRNRTLFVPAMIINDMAEIVLRNVMALEELLACSSDYIYRPSHGEKTVCEFVRFMDEIIDTEEDVYVLRKRLILRRSMGGSDHGMASIFNSFAKCVTTTTGDVLDDVREGILGHYDNKLLRLVMEFKHLYISKPWHLIALMAAFLQLLLTAIQTFYAVKS